MKRRVSAGNLSESKNPMKMRANAFCNLCVKLIRDSSKSEDSVKRRVTANDSSESKNKMKIRVLSAGNLSESKNQMKGGRMNFATCVSSDSSNSKNQMKMRVVSSSGSSESKSQMKIRMNKCILQPARRGTCPGRPSWQAS